jgi:hypothetical protein
MTQEPWNLFDCTGLTVVPAKLEHFQREAGGHLSRGLLTGWRSLGQPLSTVLAEMGVLVVQPDAIARRQVEHCLSYVARRGFGPVLTVPFTLTVDMCRTLWRFQFNAITDDSKAVGEGV